MITIIIIKLIDVITITINIRISVTSNSLTRKPKVRTAVGSNPTLDSLVAVRYTSTGRPEPCEGNLVAVAGSCGGVMVKHPWPLLGNKSLRLSRASHVKYKYLPTYLRSQRHYCTQLQAIFSNINDTSIKLL